MVKVSIIVPIYNVEKYLMECIESILKQTYENIELLLINDGSPDNSENICKKYLSDKRVKYIKKKNGGVSSARNLGIEHATGKYLLFVDSDDWLENNMIEKMLENIDERQIVFCGYNEKYLNYSHSMKEETPKNLKKIEIIESLFKYKSVSGFLWNKIYDLNIIKENNIKFDEKIKYCEDLLFNVTYLLHIKRAIIVPESLYNYRMRKSGVTWEKNEIKLKTIIESYEKIEKILESNGIYSLEFLYNKLNINFRLNIKEENKKYNEEYKKIMKSKEIPSKRKIKLFLLKNYIEIHTIYMKKKVKKNQLYE